MLFFKYEISREVERTCHLTNLELGMYSRLRDFYLSKERSIADSEKFRITRATSKSERDATNQILAEFYENKDQRWVSEYYEKIIEKAKHRAKINAENRKGGKSKVVPFDAQKGNES